MPTPPAHPPVPRTVPVPGGLLAAKALVYDPCGFTVSPPVPEPESAEYAAHAFTLDGLRVRFRAARTTPTKAGQFVTLWQRSAPGGPIRPFDTADPVDLFVVATDDGDRSGQFVFSPEALRRHGVVSARGSGGKRAFRVYPPWVTTTNRQAAAAQTWQLAHFLHLPAPAPAPTDADTDAPVDLTRARELYLSPAG
ncbi:MepB family protein [Streptomyces sp. NPDC058401]|uniref:MepB family protein n=1 Tax=Streptomyces sp. NPDC058401 TaxID=3346480 RepID=UPI00364AE663